VDRAFHNATGRWQPQYSGDVGIENNDACKWSHKYYSSHSKDQKVIDKGIRTREL
jgi:hypothetical protein